MTDDADVAALLEAAAVAGAKVVMVGDDRQLGAIGSGGSLGALVERHGGTVHRLTENVRQKTPANGTLSISSVPVTSQPPSPGTSPMAAS